MLDAGYDEELIASIEAQYSQYGKDYDPAKEYIPCWDELPENWTENDYNVSYPFEPDDPNTSIRQFYVDRPLDDHRFVYYVSSWEWSAGFGIYDLKTYMRIIRITGLGDYIGMAGDTIFGSRRKADANTYETSDNPESVYEFFLSLGDDVMDEIGCGFPRMESDWRIRAWRRGTMTRTP